MKFSGKKCLREYLDVFTSHVITSRVNLEPRKLEVNVKRLEWDDIPECGGCKENIAQAISGVVKLREASVGFLRGVQTDEERWRVE
jgi:hypothetical protein